MLENLILWLIIGAAALYAGRNLHRVITGKSKGCSCENGCEPPPPQQIIPDLKSKTVDKGKPSQ